MDKIMRVTSRKKYKFYNLRIHPPVREKERKGEGEGEKEVKVEVDRKGRQIPFPEEFFFLANLIVIVNELLLELVYI